MSHDSPERGDVTNDKFIAMCIAGSLPAIMNFVSTGRTPSMPDKDGWTGLHHSSFHGHDKIIPHLIAHFSSPAEINVQTKLGETPLMLALRQGNIEVVDALLLKLTYADLLIRAADGSTALFAAVHGGVLELFVTVVDKANAVGQASELVAMLDNEGRSVMLVAAAGGRADMVGHLADNYNGNGSYCLTAKSCDLMGNTALICAAQAGKLESVDILMKEGADISKKNLQGRTALMEAALNGRLQVARMLCERRPLCISDTDPNGRTALMWAMSNNVSGHLMVKPLIEMNASFKFEKNLNDSDNDGLTAAHWAAHYGHEHCLEAILGEGADVEARDLFGRTVLMAAAHAGQPAITRLLLETYKADALAVDKNGNNALYVAVAAGQLHCVKEMTSKPYVGHWPMALLTENELSDLRMRKVLQRLPDLERIFDVADTNSDGLLSYNELTSAVKKSPSLMKLFGEGSTSEAPAILSLLFDRADVDGDNTVDWDELRSFFIETAKQQAALSDADLLVLEVRNLTGQTALIVAAHAGQLGMVNYLLDQGCDPASQDTNGYDAFMCTVAAGQERAVRDLMSNESLRRITPTECLLLAAFHGHTHLVRTLHMMHGAKLTVTVPDSLTDQLDNLQIKRQKKISVRNKILAAAKSGQISQSPEEIKRNAQNSSAAKVSKKDAFLEAVHKSVHLLRIKTLFAALDTDSDGSISRAELTKGIRTSQVVRDAFRLLVQPGNSTSANHALRHDFTILWQHLDKDNDQLISFAELAAYFYPELDTAQLDMFGNEAGHGAFLLSPQMEQRLAIDRSKTSSQNAAKPARTVEFLNKERAAYLNASGDNQDVEVGVQMLEQFFVAVDQDESGNLSKLELSDAIQADDDVGRLFGIEAELTIDEKSHAFQMLWNRLDPSKDGRISMEELIFSYREGSFKDETTTAVATTAVAGEEPKAGVATAEPSAEREKAASAEDGAREWEANSDHIGNNAVVVMGQLHVVEVLSDDKKLSMEMLKDVFTELDKNGNGLISKAELLRALRKSPDLCSIFGITSALRMTGNGMDQFERVFQQIDLDGDKSISWKELVHTFIRVPNPTVEVDGDGVMVLKKRAVRWNEQEQEFVEVVSTELIPMDADGNYSKQAVEMVFQYDVVDQQRQTEMLQADSADDEVCTYMIQCKHIVSAGSIFGVTALMAAAYAGHGEVISYLLTQEGASLTNRDKLGRNAFMWCAVGGYIATLKDLLPLLDPLKQTLEEKDLRGNTALLLAAAHGRQTTIMSLLAAGAERMATNATGATILIVAVQNARVDLVHDLCEMNFSHHEFNMGDNNGVSALMWAARLGQVEMISALIKAGVDVEAVDDNGDRAIVWACKHAKVYSVQSLLKAGSKVTRHERDRSSPVLYASQAGHIGLLEDLLKHGGSLDCQNIEWQGPLVLAAKYDRADMVRHLIQRHFATQLDLRDRNGSTALMVSALQSSASAVRVLLDAGADVNAANSNGDTALLLGVCQVNSMGTESTLSLLINRGANIHQENAAGNNALILAAECGNLSAVKMLLSHGAQVHHVNLFGSNAATMASRGGFTETAKSVLAAGLLQREASDSDSIFVSGGNAVISAAHAQHHDTAEALYSQLLDRFLTHD